LRTSSKIIVLFLASLIFGLSGFSPSEKTEHPGLKILSGMLDSIKNIRTLAFHLKAMERVEGKFLTAESKVKITYSPKIIYFRNEQRKISVLWKEGSNGNNAVVKAKMLMNAAVSLDPYGNMMRKNQHYTIHELGFNFFASVFSSALLKNKEHLSSKLIYLGKKPHREKSCHVLMFDDPDFGYFDYRVGKNESVSSIAIKFNVSDYVIRSKNALHTFYGTIKEGKIIKIPNSYCKKVILFLDEKTMLPVNITTYDDTGLYENYEYLSIEVNKKFSPEDFQQFYKD
jgi:hypothetical protein